PHREIGLRDEALVEQRLHQRGEQRLGRGGDHHGQQRNREANPVGAGVTEQSTVDRPARLRRFPAFRGRAQYSTSAASGCSTERIAPIRSSCGCTRQRRPSSTAQAASPLPYSTTTGIAGVSSRSPIANGAIAPRSAAESAIPFRRMRSRLPNSCRAPTRSSSRSATTRWPPLYSSRLTLP